MQARTNPIFLSNLICFSMLFANDERPTTASPKLLQKPHVSLKKQLQIIQPILQHRYAVHAHAEGKAGNFLGIVAVVLHELEDVRIDHAAAEDLNPSGLLTGTAWVSTPSSTPTAYKAGDEHLCAWLSKREE